MPVVSAPKDFSKITTPYFLSISKVVPNRSVMPSRVVVIDVVIKFPLKIPECCLQLIWFKKLVI